jgi:hypothetical protein
MKKIREGRKVRGKISLLASWRLKKQRAGRFSAIDPLGRIYLTQNRFYELNSR